MADCKYCYGDEEVCVNADCPCCTEWCPVVNHPGVCRFEERLPNKEKENIMEKYIGTKMIEAEPFDRVSGDKAEMWYKVRYPDGYESWSPKSVFEEACRRTDGMNFGLAIEAMWKGCKVRRRGWNGKGIHIELQVPDAHSKMTSPYIYIDTTGLQTTNPDAPKSRVPWLASQTDMLADDWEIVE